MWGPAYQTTKAETKYGKPESRYPHKRNPDLKGFVCKHTQAVLDVFPFYVSDFAKTLKDYYSDDVDAVVNKLIKKEPEKKEVEPENKEDKEETKEPENKDTKESVNELNDYKSIWNLTTTDYPYADDALSRGKAKIEWVSPSDYIDMSAQVQGVSRSETLKAVDYNKVRKYKSAMLNGDKFPMLAIEKGYGQEGRHRALAASDYYEWKKIKGKVPVVIFNKNVIKESVNEVILNWNELDKANVGDYAYIDSTNKTVQQLLEVPVNEIEFEPTNTIYADVVKRYMGGYNKMPVIYKDSKTNKYLVDDGHHRIKADIDNGKKTILAWVRKGLVGGMPNPFLDSVGGVNESIDVDSPDFKSWFDGSKVVDANGNPLVVYHGSDKDFTEFSYKHLGTHGFTEGVGFYFTNDAGVADHYAKGRGANKYYLSIKNPMGLVQRRITKAKLRKIFYELYKLDNDAISNYGDYIYYGVDRVISDAVKIESANETDAEIMGSLLNGGIASADVIVDVFSKVTGYDGIITQWGLSDGSEGPRIYVAWFNEQIKRIDDMKNESVNEEVKYKYEVGLEVPKLGFITALGVSNNGTIPYYLMSLNKDSNLVSWHSEKEVDIAFINKVHKDVYDKEQEEIRKKQEALDDLHGFDKDMPAMKAGKIRKTLLLGRKVRIDGSDELLRPKEFVEKLLADGYFPGGLHKYSIGGIEKKDLLAINKDDDVYSLGKTEYDYMDYLYNMKTKANEMATTMSNVAYLPGGFSKVKAVLPKEIKSLKLDIIEDKDIDTIKIGSTINILVPKQHRKAWDEDWKTFMAANESVNEGDVVWKKQPLVKGKIYKTSDVFEPDWSHKEGYRQFVDPNKISYPKYIQSQGKWTELPNGQVVRPNNTWHTEFVLAHEDDDSKFGTVQGSVDKTNRRRTAANESVNEGDAYTSIMNATKRWNDTYAPLKGRRVIVDGVTFQYSATNDTGVPYFVKVINGRPQKQEHILFGYNRDWAKDELAKLNKNESVFEALTKDNDIYKKLITLMGDYDTNFPATGINGVFNKLIDNGRGSVPKDKVAQSILSYIVYSHDSTPAKVHAVVNTRFSSLPMDVRPLCKNGRRKEVAFWNGSNGIGDRVLDLIDVTGKNKGYWCDIKGKKVELVDSNSYT
jgi:hypothetical protein